MLSLLRWSLGSASEHLTEEQRIKAVAKRNPDAMASLPPVQPKRKRTNSVLSPGLAAGQRPAKRSAVTHAAAAADDADDLTDLSDTNVRAHAIRDSDRPAQSSSSAHAVPTPPASTDCEQEKEHMDVVDLISEEGEASAVAAKDLEIPTVSKAVDMSAVQQAIESEFCLEILLKHKELRLIDQEIAKCQVALEQLRRCALVPYPAATSTVDDMLNVSAGSGISLRNHAGNRDATDPAPWGVTEGPYSRHYAQWLLPDPAFDGGDVEYSRQGMRGGKSLPERHTRGSKGEQSALSSKSRAQRGLPGSRLHALPAGYPEPKEEKGPMIVKRASDNKFVKLVCIDCKRENFNSAQGFINHCRIAHGRGFASHEAAAQACGQEVEATETTSAATAPDGGAAPVPMSVGLVHPLIRSSASIPTLSIPTPRKQQAKTQAHFNKAAQTPTAPPSIPSIRKNAVDEYSHVPFMPSSNTPHLSKLFAKSGRGGDLGDFVADATVKEDLDAVAADDEAAAWASDSDFEMEDTPVRSHAGVRLRGRLRAGPSRMSPAPGDRPHSRKGLDRSVVKPPGVLSSHGPPHAGTGTTTTVATSTPIFHINPHSHNHTTTHTSTSITTADNQPTTFELLADGPLTHDLSPHTVESNNAPSLVSDSSASEDSEDDDEDEEDAADDYETGTGTSLPDSEVGHSNGHSNSGSGRDGHHHHAMEVDFEIEDVVRERGADGHGHHHPHHHSHHHHHVDDDDVGEEKHHVGVGVGGPSKSADPELRASGKAKAKVLARRRQGGGGGRKRGGGIARGDSSGRNGRSRAG